MQYTNLELTNLNEQLNINNLVHFSDFYYLSASIFRLSLTEIDTIIIIIFVVRHLCIFQSENVSGNFYNVRL